MSSQIKLKEGFKAVKVLHNSMSFSGLCASSSMEGDNKSYTIFQRNLHHIQKVPVFSSFFHRSGLASLVMNEYEIRFFS